jgi:glutathione S-transferase
MATMIVKMRVANFERWKADFETMNGARAAHGWVSHRIVRDGTDPNIVTVISRVRDLDSAKQYGQSAGLREAMQRSGVQGPPEVSFCEDEAEGTYENVVGPSPKLHFFPPSTSSRTVLLFCAEARISFEPVIVDLRNGGQFKDSFLALNPSHMVPVLEDGDFILTECSAILKYLADKHDSPGYPKDLRKRARVNERMDWVNTNLLREWTHHLIYPQIFPDHRRVPELAQSSLLEWGKPKAEHWLAILDEKLIGPNRYLCGEEITIADYFAAEILWSGTLIGATFERYPNIERWMATMRSLRSWAKVNEAVNGFAATLRGKPFVTIGK